MLHPVNIGILHTAGNLVVSPMAGVTDAPFRQIALLNGADYAISEMLTSQTELWDNEKSKQRLKSITNHQLNIIQIAGASPEVIAEAVIACEKLGVDAIEINMGCPAKKVCNVLAGSALLKDEKLVTQIIQAATQSSNLPVLLKTRLGWNHENKNILQIAKIAEDNGIKSLTIHGRTRCDMYNNQAKFDLIAKVKQQANIPVFANGNITTPEQAKEILEFTKCDGLYIGRGALGQPWLFQQIKDYINKNSYSHPNKTEIIQIILEHIKLIHAHYGDFMGVRFARKHVKWYNEKNHLIDKDGLSVFTSLENQAEQINWLTKLL